MTFLEPWYLMDLSLAQRFHPDPVAGDRAPLWRTCERVARRLVELFPNASPTEVRAALLHRALDGTRKPRMLIELRVPGDVIAVILALDRRPDPDTRPDPTIARVRAAIASVRQDSVAAGEPARMGARS